MSTTRLAAIMFTDIVGYTAMMQTDQTKAMAVVKQYEAVLKDRISHHKGELLQTYGDGSLSIFESASAAVRCAKELQEQVRDQVPLRIGIHLGEITIDGDHTFGDGVNIASRVESMGVAGAVLVSSNVRNQIKNKPEFELTSLGKFAFKNVEGPISVYALANEGLVVPLVEEMKGKGERLKETQTASSSTRSLFLLASIGFAAMVLGAGIFWMISAANEPDQSKVSEEIRASRIAVLPFENKTNDPAFDVLGDMAADHVIQGMMNLDEVKVVSYATIRENLKVADPNSQDFAQRTGAEKLIKGNIYKEGDSLFIKSQVIDLESGELDFALPDIKTSIDEPRKLVNELHSRIMGFFVIEKDIYMYISSKGGDAPLLKAFEAYQTALEHFLLDDNKCQQYLEEAIRLDSTYYWPYQLYFWTWSNAGIMDKADSVVNLMDSRFPRKNSYQRLAQNLNRKIVNEGLLNSLPETRALFSKDPKTHYFNILMGIMCMYRNLPQEGIDAMSAIQAAHHPNAFIVQTWWHGVYAFHLLRKGRDQDAREVLSYVPIEKYHLVAIRSRLLYHAKRGERDSVEIFLRELAAFEYGKEQLNRRQLDAANYFAIYGDTVAQKAMAREIMIRLEDRGLAVSGLILDALILAEEYDRALAVAHSLLQSQANNPGILAKMGWIYGQEGKTAEAQSVLNQFNQQFPDTGHYQRAWIQASQGDQAAAMQSLSKAFKDGEQAYDNARFDFSHFLLPMWDYEPFVEMFVKPRE